MRIEDKWQNGNREQKANKWNYTPDGQLFAINTAVMLVTCLRWTVFILC
jgi:hypothetical protein